MANNPMDNCTHNCHTCGSACSSPEGERKPSFFDRLESASEHFEKMGEDNFIQMLNDAVAELEKDDEEENAQ